MHVCPYRGRIQVPLIPISQVGVNDSLVPGLAGRMKCQTQSVCVGLTLEPVKLELIVSIVNNIATEPTVIQI